MIRVTSSARQSLAAAYLAAVLGLSAAAETPELVFHATFDGDATATVAKGKAAPSIAKGLQYASGKFGRAVRLSFAAKSRLSYEMEGNVNRERGTVALWFKREWGEEGEGVPHYIFANPCGKNRLGTGALILWWIDGRLRADVSDDADSKIYGFNPPRPGEWVHVAWSWTPDGQWLYVNGIPVRRMAGDSGSPTKAAKSPAKEYKFSRPAKYRTFEIGSRRGQDLADGLVDDLRIYSGPLSQKDVERLVRDGGGTLMPPSAPDWNRLFSIRKPNSYEGGFAERAGEFRAEDLELLDEVRFDSPDTVAALRNANRFNSVGELRFGNLGGTPYIENARESDKRWALRLKVDPSAPLHVIDIDYPDDAVRTMNFIMQRCDGQKEYAMQVGVACGGEYVSTGRILTHRCVYWTPREPNGDVALVAMNPRPDSPVAVSAVRVYRVKNGVLPVARLNLPPPVGGWRRSIGLFFEDPAIYHDFAENGVTTKSLSRLIDRAVATMKFTGENLFAYPGAWYQGLIGGKDGYYNPRNHAPDFLSAWYAKFDAEGLSIMPTLNVLNMKVPGAPLTAASLDDGSLHPTCVSILNTGRPNDYGWHGTPPIFNIAHPDTQRYFEEMVDALVAQGRGHPSFKGICLHVTRHGMMSWGGIESGYNDYCIDAFERAKGIHVPCDRSDPLRGKAYFEWIRDNAMEQWIDWRCDVFTAFWGRMARKLAAARPDLKLWIACFTTVSVSKFAAAHERFFEPDFIVRANREFGIDAAKLEKAIPNLILAQATVPADNRKIPNLKPDVRNRLVALPVEKCTFAMLDDALFPWIGVFDRYWESAVGKASSKKGGKNSLSHGWLKECEWRVSTINPSGFNAMRHFVEPLRHRDILGMFKGGYLIGTYGMEPNLAKFAQAFLALPAVKMDEFFRSGDVVGRKAKCGGRIYGYIVNTGTTSAKVKPGIPSGAKDCASGRPMMEQLTLAPYELVSFVK